jgi:hypothetical protein
MNDSIPRTERRPVRVQTVFGTVEGWLRCAPNLRTLDGINLAPNGFLTLHDPSETFTGQKGRPERIVLSRSAVLFVTEIGEVAPPAVRRVEAGRYPRAPIHLRVDDYELRGFFHVPHGGDAMTRLGLAPDVTFLALTSVSVLGPDCHLAAPFLAVNRTHILVAREIAMGCDSATPPLPDCVDSSR